MKLPLEIIEKIALFLNIPSLESFQYTSKENYLVVNNLIFYEKWVDANILATLKEYKRIIEINNKLKFGILVEKFGVEKKNEYWEWRTTCWLFKKVMKLDIFNDKELELVLHKYNLLHKRDYLNDMILDEFTILESIFTKGSIGEVSYRLSSNLAFFLAEDLDEFKEIQNCVKDFYKIRSKIAHGEDWTHRISREKYRSHLEIEDPNTPPKAIIEGIYRKLGDYIDKTIKNIIESWVRF